MPGGGSAMYTTAPCPTLPAAPACAALTPASQNISPGATSASSSVTKRTPPAVMQTVPWGTWVAVSPAWST